jgi:hypothetical protein
VREEVIALGMGVEEGLQLGVEMEEGEEREMEEGEEEEMEEVGEREKEVEEMGKSLEEWGVGMGKVVGEVEVGSSTRMRMPGCLGRHCM